MRSSSGALSRLRIACSFLTRWASSRAARALCAAMLGHLTTARCHMAAARPGQCRGWELGSAGDWGGTTRTESTATAAALTIAELLAAGAHAVAAGRALQIDVHAELTG